MIEELGKRIRTLRKNKDYTLEKLANLTESSKSYIWGLENDVCTRPSINKICKIADALDTTIDNLLGRGRVKQ